MLKPGYKLILNNKEEKIKKSFSKSFWIWKLKEKELVLFYGKSSWNWSGTTFSAIAELDDLGNPEVLSDPETGNRITRSAVFFGKDTVIVGEKAKDAAVTNPKKVVFEVKREMENDVIYSLNRKFEENDNKIKGYTPSQISSLILSKLKDFSSKINKAVKLYLHYFQREQERQHLTQQKLQN